jgi:peptidoglycan-associated lipoprotein
MKNSKVIHLLALILVVTLAGTGCRNHKPVGVTQLPGQTSSGPRDQDNQTTLPQNIPPFGVDSNGHIEQANNLDKFANTTEDAAALAANTVHFAFDSAAVRKSEQANVQAVANALGKDSSALLRIEGNCDERGTEEYNRSLGERRALALREALAKLGVDPARIQTVSFGKDRPVDTANNEAAWSKNRRGEFVLLHPKSGA